MHYPRKHYVSCCRWLTSTMTIPPPHPHTHRLLMQNGGTANFLDWDIFRHFDVRGALEPHMLLALGVVPDALDHSTD